MHGADIVVTVLSDPELYSLWKKELADMSARIQQMRTALKAALVDVGCPGDWNHIINQIGMFSFTGLNKAQCENMTKKWRVYMTMVSSTVVPSTPAPAVLGNQHCHWPHARMCMIGCNLSHQQASE